MLANGGGVEVDEWNSDNGFRVSFHVTKGGRQLYFCLTLVDTWTTKFELCGPHVLFNLNTV